MPNSTIKNSPALHSQGAVPSSVGAPGLTRTPAPTGTPLPITLFYVTENGAVSVGTGTNNNGAVAPASSYAFDIQSQIGGFGLPRMTTTQRDLIPVSASVRPMVFNVTTNTIDLYNGSGWVQSPLTIPASIPNVALTLVERDADKLIRVSGVNNGGDTTRDLTMGSGRDIVESPDRDYLVNALRHALITAVQNITMQSTGTTTFGAGGAFNVGATTTIEITVAGTSLRISNVGMGFYGTAPVARPTTYTITFAPVASSVLPAAVNEAFAGIDNTAVGTVFATNANLNTVATQVNANAAVLKRVIAGLTAQGLIAP